MIQKKAFDDSGDRIYAEYDVMNIGKKGVTKVVGSFFFDTVSFLSFAQAGYFGYLKHFENLMLSAFDISASLTS